MVTSSTSSWVRARSGADSLTKASETISPTTLSNTSAVQRWRCSQTVPMAPTARQSPAARLTGSSGVSGTGPRSAMPQLPVISTAAALASVSVSMRCIEARCSTRFSRPVRFSSQASRTMNTVRPSMRPNRRSCQRNRGSRAR